MAGILDVEDRPWSARTTLAIHSSIVDADNVMVQGDSVKILSWYDNEWGFSARMVDLSRLFLKGLS